MAAIRNHTEAAIGAAPRGRMNEGFLQTAIAKAEGETYTHVDREIMLAFWGDDAKQACKSALAAPLLEAVFPLTSKKWAAMQATKPPGDKIDALAIDKSGASS